MQVITSFPPLVDVHCTRLILGSMPGVASLKAQQYYAHPRNQFWDMLETVLGIARTQDYASRCRAVLQEKLAIWDVLQQCERPGSLDTSIVAESVVVNDFASFFQTYPNIHTLYFNGGKAWQLYQRLVKPVLPAAQLNLVQLPSTSPAHAAISRAEKLAFWQIIRS